jgi:hypothetical protein
MQSVGISLREMHPLAEREDYSAEPEWPVSILFGPRFALSGGVAAKSLAPHWELGHIVAHG